MRKDDRTRIGFDVKDDRFLAAQRIFLLDDAARVEEARALLRELRDESPVRPSPNVARGPIVPLDEERVREVLAEVKGNFAAAGRVLGCDFRRVQAVVRRAERAGRRAS